MLDILNKHINDLTKDNWVELYYNRGMSLPQLAKHFNLNAATISAKMEKCGVSRRGFGPKASLIIPQEVLEELYVKQRLSAAKIANKLSCSDTTVRKKLKEYGILRPRAENILTKEFLQQERENGTPVKEIAIKSGFSKPVVYKFLHRHGLDVGAGFIPSSISGDVEKTVIGLYVKGMKTTEISEIIGKGTTFILRTLNKFQIPIRGTNHYRRKIKDPDTLVQLYKEGKSIGEVAEELGVTRRAVSYWLEKEETPLRSKKEASLGDKNHMKNKKHSDKTRSKMAQVFIDNIRSPPAGPRGNIGPLETPKQGIVTVKSSWEGAVGRYFNSKEVDYLYEPTTLVATVGNVRVSYTPDFKVYTPDAPQGKYIEVKGYFSDANKKKMEHFVSAYNIEIWDGPKLQSLGVLDNSFRPNPKYALK